jgi:rhodanese-related sulfurtransferase
MRSGKPRQSGTGAGSLAQDEVWAPLGRSYAGLPEVSPDWVASHRDQLTILDVRSAEEFSGPDGRISGSLLIPLPELEARSGELPAGAPVVVACHSGSRSALATQQLLKAGHLQVANLHGGLARWADGGYPLDGVIATGSPPH